MGVSPLVWVLTILVVVTILVLDVFVVGRRPHEPSDREAASYLLGYSGLAVLFGIGIWYFYGSLYATEFFVGWITEYSLSVDNIFIFLLIMTKLGVPQQLQQTALTAGIMIALVLRGIFIAIGAIVIQQFSWAFYVFGAFLIYTAIQILRDGESDDDEYQEGWIIRSLRRVIPSVREFHGTKLFIRDAAGSRFVTPMFFVIAALGVTDLLFALDSIPAIYGLTNEPYLVFSANVFALLGLRQLYFLIASFMKRLVFLGYGLAALLFFIGVKLVIEALEQNSLSFINGGNPVTAVPHIGQVTSLLIVVGILATAVAASLVANRWSKHSGDQQSS